MTPYGVWQVEAHEIDQLTAVLGNPQLIDDRFRRQKDGEGKLFAAWKDDEPPGLVYLWRREAEEQEIRDHLPGVALLMNLEVLPHLRNQGIGRKLIAEVEGELLKHGQDQVALAVRTNNKGAIRLYHRLGFAIWGHPDVICYARIHRKNGRVTLKRERCHVMVKNLREQACPAVTTDEKQAIRRHERFGVRWAHRMATRYYAHLVQRAGLVRRERGDVVVEDLRETTPGQAA
ncbi:GNAT family N-acetyltransferase [Amycolatopsis sp. NPDC051128]|uniref:GNAT family N-acetyltransferase n=1 Tax=Amycolatopsis sp. NPDC051128 TaxID=3155412 RepID=UPI00342E3760